MKVIKLSLLSAIITTVFATAMNISKTDQSQLDGFLLNAVRGGDIERVEQLIEKGADVNARRKIQGDTALHLAAYLGHSDIVQLLLKNNAEINAVDDFGYTPLFDAISSNKPDLVAILLTHRASVHAQTKDGDTPLHNAVLYNNGKIIKMLLEHGAHINARNNKKETPLCLATQNNKLNAVKKLLRHKKIKVDKSDCNGNTPLHWAASFDCVAIAQKLIATGAQVYAKNVRGYTPLAIIQFTKNACMLELLQSKKINKIQVQESY